MYNNNWQNEKHKVFVSFYHKDDQGYKDAFEKAFGHLFINKSVQEGDINTDVSTEYIKRLIQSSDYLRDASVTIVLCGLNTKKRKHVDWEISGALDKKLSGYSGLIGILLPEISLSSEGNYSYSDIPSRLADNVKTKYAKIYTWNWLCSDSNRVKEAIDDAFNQRTNDNLIDNSRTQMLSNLF